MKKSASFSDPWNEIRVEFTVFVSHAAFTENSFEPNESASSPAISISQLSVSFRCNLQ